MRCLKFEKNRGCFPTCPKSLLMTIFRRQTGKNKSEVIKFYVSK